MRNRELNVESIRSIFLIDSNETQLIAKIAQGDKVALVHLCLLNMPYILSAVQRNHVQGVPMAERINAGMQGFMNAVEEHLLKVKPQVNEMIDFDFHRAVNNSLSSLQGFEYEPRTYTPARIAFLNRLNRILTAREHQIVQRCLELVRHCEQRKKGIDPFTVDYMLFAEVNYYIPSNEGNPAHTYSTNFNAEDLLPGKTEYNLLCGEEDWAEPGWPPLSERYCYLLHDLLDHSHLGTQVFEVDTIWFDIIMYNQDGIRVSPSGDFTLLHFNEEKKFFE